MSLIAWFQLNGNLRNNGLTNGISASSTVACQTTGSPLNCGCYKFTTGQSITFTGINFSKLSKASVSLWVYQDSKVNTVFFTGQGTSYYLGASQNTGTSDFYHGQVNGTKISYVDGVPGTKLGSAGAWHHYVFTDVNLSSWSAFKFNNYSSGFNFAGRVFDIRIYDHVLCEDDVKRIYQRKIYELVPYSGSKNVLFDRSGYCFMPIVNNGAVFNANSLYFDGGASTRLRPQKGNVGFNLTGGTLSVWFKPISKPSDYRLIVIDSTSKMAIGFYNSGNHLLLTSNGTSSTAFTSTSIKYGELNNIIVGYSSNLLPQYCVINGVAVAQNGGSSYWSETGGLTIGGRTYNNLNFNGTIYKVELHKKSLTSDEAIELYNLEKGLFLPDDYIQLEYIQSTGTQYIDTLIHPTINTGVQLKMTLTTVKSGDNVVFGATDKVAYANGKPYSIDVFSNQVLFPHGATSSNSIPYDAITASTVANQIMNLQINYYGDNKVIYNDNKKSKTATESITSKTLHLFNLNNSNGGLSQYAPSGMKCYSLKITEGSVLVGDFVPAKRKSDNVIGMYDMVSRKFFTNSGSGSFTGA